MGVNKFQMNEDIPIELMKTDPREEERQIAKVQRLRKERDNKGVEVALSKLKQAAQEGTNLVFPILAAVRAYSTVGDTLRDVYGEYQRPAY